MLMECRMFRVRVQSSCRILRLAYEKKLDEQPLMEKKKKEEEEKEKTILFI